MAAGADVITMGDHTWDQREMVDLLNDESRVLRSANFDRECPGHGSVTVGTEWGDVTVVNLVGRVFMKPYECPFRAVDSVLEGLRPGGSHNVFVDFHAEATSEKIAMGRYLDGRVTAVAGTHTHVQTSDETLLPDGTAYITDLGLTGPVESVIGRSTATIIRLLKTGMKVPCVVADGESGTRLEGAGIGVDENSGGPRGIWRRRGRARLGGSVTGAGNLRRRPAGR